MFCYIVKIKMVKNLRYVIFGQPLLYFVSKYSQPRLKNDSFQPFPTLIFQKKKSTIWWKKNQPFQHFLQTWWKNDVCMHVSVCYLVKQQCCVFACHSAARCLTTPLCGSYRPFSEIVCHSHPCVYAHALPPFWILHLK